MRHLIATTFVLTATLLVSHRVASAAEDKPVAKPAPVIELGTPFRDNAILQREMDLPVWGWSKPGTTVTVEFAGQKEIVKAGADGKWMLKLKPLKASAEPTEMLISDSEGKKVALKNLLVGEVWHASGQSNMEWFAGKSMPLTGATSKPPHPRRCRWCASSGDAPRPRRVQPQESAASRLVATANIAPSGRPPISPRPTMA